jgi:uncharacterized membrane protein YccC
MQLSLLRTPPPRFVYAFQLALALVIGYGLALWFDWERPRWSAFAIIAVAVPHIGMSLARAGQRLKGTLLGAAVALVIVAVFPQDRWLFILALSLWLSACAYMMCFSQRNYFWFCAGLICSIIASTAANTGGNAFMLAIERTLETSLGVIVYSVVALLVWRQEEPPMPPSLAGAFFFPDRDAVVASVRVFILYWMSFLAVVYIPDFPVGLTFLAPMGGFALQLATMPQLPIRALYIPLIAGVVIASVIYMLVMPILDGYAALGLLIFIVGLTAGYRYYAPQETVMRMLILVIFASLTGINNDQVYSFSAVSNNTLIFAWVLVLLHISTYIPESKRPETRFLRLLERYQRSARILTDPAPANNWLQRWGLAYHRHEIATIPGKMASWQPHLAPALVAAAGDELKTLMQLLKDSQARLQAKTGTAPDASQETPVLQELESACAMIDWTRWREAKF